MMCAYARDCSECNRPYCPLIDNFDREDGSDDDEKEDW